MSTGQPPYDGDPKEVGIAEPETFHRAGPQPAHLPLMFLEPSATNPRAVVIEDAEFENLVESIRTVGILQPVLVRRILPSRQGAVTYEIIAGHRRVAAAAKAGLESVPVMIHELTDTEVLEVQLIENLHRKDISELEEAAGYARLQADYHYSVEDIAAKVGKSRAYVYGRLRLASLPASTKKAIQAGKILPGVAMLIARIPDPDLQEKATKDLSQADHFSGEPYTFRSAARHVLETFMLDLKGAPFPTGDPDLLDDVGACENCPHRTGNQSDLFGEVQSADVCTNPPCFQRKRAAATERIVEAAEKQGLEVLSRKESGALYYYGNLNNTADYIDPSHRAYQDPKSRTWQKLLGKDAPPAVIAIDPDGAAHRLFRRKEAEAVLRAKYDWARPAARSPNSDAGKRAREAKVQAAVARETMTRLVAAMEQSAVEPGAFWRGVALAAIHRAWSDTLREVCKRRGLTDKRKGRCNPSWQDRLLVVLDAGDLTIDQTRALALEVILGAAVTGSPMRSDSLSRRVGETFRELFSIDVKEIEASIRASMADPAKKKATVPTAAEKPAKKTMPARRRAALKRKARTST